MPAQEPTQRQPQHQVQHVEPPQVYPQVQCIRNGRSHATDAWELPVKKGEVLDDLGDIGNGWRYCRNKRGQQGYVHTSWLDFNYGRHTKDHYQHFAELTSTIFEARALTAFPDLSGFASLCAEKTCKATKDDANGIGICAHALEKVLRGSGHYTVDFLKDERVKWHPDKFARLCHPDYQESLKKKAECMFVFFGMLLDVLEFQSS
ncbi:hypothetical protein BDV96DRAFT_642265 [Lophiotrema nucula]|uniref:SH3 domain-containing protein n=1 Tax=Lophiotrema nucula TaxID=690887 RepID=A0A6A5ZLA3_9PLEO|nr:hypothetical protein BDV96DRAFT_642265 [Lophiotrema nucula]